MWVLLTYFVIIFSKALGNVLAINGTIQMSESDEFHFQEICTHVPLNCHPNPKDVSMKKGQRVWICIHIQLNCHPNIGGGTGGGGAGGSGPSTFQTAEHSHPQTSPASHKRDGRRYCAGFDRCSRAILDFINLPPPLWKTSQRLCI